MDAVEIVVDPRKERTLFAKTGFKEDELVFEETPVVSCQFPYNQDLKYAACDHCLSPLETALQCARRLAQEPDLQLPGFPDNLVNVREHVSCPTCHAKYCSQKCLETAHNYYHKSICAEDGTPESRAILALRKKWQSIHFPPEESTIMLVLRIYAIIHSAADKNAAISQFQDFHSLATLDKHKQIIQELHPLLLKCVEILHLDVPAYLLMREAFAKILAILATNSQGIATCSFARWVQQNDKNDDNDEFGKFVDALYDRFEETVGSDFLDNEGAGLYSIQSKMSHSCDPNTKITFDHENHILCVRALKDIHPGDELTFSYIDECDLNRSRHSRQKIIREKFLFDCICQRCEAEVDHPDITSESEMETDDENDAI